MAASVLVDEEGAFRSGTPESLFDIGTSEYEPSTDGQRFLLVEEIEKADAPPVTVVLNWPALLEGVE